MEHIHLNIRSKPALQQPDWHDDPRLAAVTDALSRSRPLVRDEDVHTLRLQLAAAARGDALVIQSGDCAEDPDEHTPGYVGRKTALLDLMAGTMKMNTGKPVIRVGRIAGQYSKPRSSNVEKVGELELPPYRGHMVNRPEPTHRHRRPDPVNILTGYAAARRIAGHLGWHGERRHAPLEAPVWTSHEALLLDYELPMLRLGADCRMLLTSTHWPWIGERTRQVDGAHVALLAQVSNPVACKVGPSMARDELLALCDRLDPGREPGRLTLIARMGANAVGEKLTALVEAVREGGHPVLWMTDPMHGNTVTTPDGVKTRYIETIVREVRDFQAAVCAGGGVAAGMHLETTPDDVTECVADAESADMVAHKYTTLCDPRLNPRQAVEVAAAWHS